jgi:hypothetical protein
MKLIIVLLCSLWLLGACTSSPTTLNITSSSFEGEDFIPIHTANTMIESFIESLPSNTDTNVKSWILQADALRELLADNEIVMVKVMLAHNEEWIDTKGDGIPVGYNNEALTIVLAGADKDGNYVLPEEPVAINKARPCPPSCPEGTAANNLIVTN